MSKSFENLETIYETFNPGSTGFIKAVQTHCCFAVSDDEIRRIAHKAETPEDFQKIWENEDWWIDK